MTDIARTPGWRFADVPDYPYEPVYTTAVRRGGGRL